MTMPKTAEQRLLYLQRLSLLQEPMRDLKNADGNQRLRASQVILNLCGISENEENPLHGATVAEHDVATREARDARRWVQGFLQNRDGSGVASSSHVNAVADQMINMLSGNAGGGRVRCNI
eukprot:s799_g23.t1